MRYIVLALTAITLAGCSGVDVSASGPRLVTYRVTGTAYRANIMYDNETNGNSNVKSGHDPFLNMLWA
jgi:uncharacterized protein YceK